MQSINLNALQDLALVVREHILRLSTNGGCFTGASLSCADIIVYLYSSFLNVSPKNLNDENRDYLFLSKGHDVPALYATLAELNFFDKDRLQNHLKTNDYLYWHPNTQIPGIEFHSGSLGHLPSVALGVAYDAYLKGTSNKIIVITGDGELNEGSVWETLLVATAYKLNNFTMVVDRNFFQANLPTEELIPLEPLIPKFEAFGCAVKRINGHDFNQLHDAFSSLPFSNTQPNVIIADTIRGKGCPSIEARADRWFCNFTQEEVEALIQELYGNRRANLESETLTVR
jgi:transketolase